MTSQPSPSHTLRRTSLWPMPFMPLKASLRTLSVPTTIPPALDLAVTPERSFRASSGSLLGLLLFIRAAHFFSSVLHLSQAHENEATQTTYRNGNVSHSIRIMLGTRYEHRMRRFSIPPCPSLDLLSKVNFLLFFRR